MNKPSVTIQRNGEVYARQIAFCAAFILPMGKFLETPSLLAQYARGDILLPAIAHFLVQSLLLLGILYAASTSEKTLLERLQSRLGKGVVGVYILFILYYLFAAALPLLDLEKFVYAAFFDTAPTTFSFGTFFLLAAFVCAKGFKSFGRCADLCLFLFLLPFLALIAMSLFESDLTRLLPFFGTEFSGLSQGFIHTTPHFADAVLLLPLIANYRYKKGDGVKIMSGYWAGAGMTLLFFAVFFGIFSSLAPREHYAFSKIAQYFSALDVVGRIDLVFVYLLSAVLLFYTCLPLLYATDFSARLFNVKRKSLFAAGVALCALLFVLFMNKHYNAIYTAIGGKFAPVFWFVAYLLPLFCLFLTKSKENSHAQSTQP